MPQLVVPIVAGAVGATAGTFGYSLVNVAVSLAFAAVSAEARKAFADKGGYNQDVRRDLYFPAELPLHRFVYGETRATATVLPHPVIGDKAYGVYLLNSRPSDGAPTLFLDSREIPLTGDPYDFSGSGAIPSSGNLQNHLRVWIGRGDQTGPPDTFLSECPYDASTQPLGFRSTDAGAGLTIVYIRYVTGDSSTITNRWPNVPPQMDVEGLRTPVYDQREVTHDPEDESTWEGTSTFSLNAQDVLRNNPFRPYDDKYLLLDMIGDAADVDDEAVALSGGGSEARYTLDGTVIFDGAELEQLMIPIMAAGAANIVRIGAKIGFVPGQYAEPEYELTTLLGGLTFSNMSPASELPTQIKTVYAAKNRGYADAELAIYDIPGVGAGEGKKVLSQSLPYTTSAYRAMRLRKIRGAQAREQRQLGGVAPPSALDLVVGAGVTVGFGAPYDERVDGIYKVQSTQPLLSPLGDSDGVAMRVPITMIGNSEAVWDWSTSDEEPVFDPPYDVSVNGVQTPGDDIAAVTGNTVNLDTGGTIVPRVYYYGTPSPSSGIAHYEWEARASIGGFWGEKSGTIGGDVDDGSGNIFLYVEWPAGSALDLQWRAVNSSGQKSEWVQLTGVTPVVTGSLSVPTMGTLSEAPAGTVTIPVTAPNDSGTKGIDVYSGPDSDVVNANPVSSTIYTTANVTIQDVEAGFSSGVTVYYFARTVGDFGTVSPWTAGQSITTA